MYQNFSREEMDSMFVELLDAACVAIDPSETSQDREMAREVILKYERQVHHLSQSSLNNMIQQLEALSRDLRSLYWRS